MTIDELNPKLVDIIHIGKGNMPANVKSFNKRITRWHELDIITWGEGADVINGKSYPVTAGDLFYRSPGMINQHFLPYHLYYFMFDPCYSAKNKASYGVGDPTDAFTPFDPPEAMPLFNFASSPYLGKARDVDSLVALSYKLFVEFNHDDRDELKIKFMFLQLLHDVVKQLSPNPYASGLVEGHEHYQQRIIDICRSISDNPEPVYTLKDVASRANLSPNFFCKIFKEVTGHTFIQYVNRVKIDHVKLLLLDSEMSVEEIAESVSFCDATYLYSLFKRSTGMTPSDYRSQRLAEYLNKCG